MSCQLPGKGTTHQSRSAKNRIWWPSQSVLERKSPWRSTCTLTPTPQAASLWLFMSKPFTTHQRHVLSGGFPVLAGKFLVIEAFSQCALAVSCGSDMQTELPVTFKSPSSPIHLNLALTIPPATATYCCQQNSEFKFASCKYLQGS